MRKRNVRRGFGGRSEIEDRGASGQLFGLTVIEYAVGDWCPTPDGSGPAEALAIQIKTNNPDLTPFLRLKTPEAVDDLIAALVKHRRSVWPAEPARFGRVD